MSAGDQKSSLIWLCQLLVSQLIKPSVPSLALASHSLIHLTIPAQLLLPSSNRLSVALTLFLTMLQSISCFRSSLDTPTSYTFHLRQLLFLQTLVLCTLVSVPIIMTHSLPTHKINTHLHPVVSRVQFPNSSSNLEQLPFQLSPFSSMALCGPGKHGRKRHWSLASDYLQHVVLSQDRPHLTACLSGGEMSISKLLSMMCQVPAPISPLTSL